jgi:hypothetical protein
MFQTSHYRVHSITLLEAESAPLFK